MVPVAGVLTTSLAEAVNRAISRVSGLIAVRHHGFAPPPQELSSGGVLSSLQQIHRSIDNRQSEITHSPRPVKTQRGGWKTTDNTHAAARGERCSLILAEAGVTLIVPRILDELEMTALR